MGWSIIEGGFVACFAHEGGARQVAMRDVGEEA